MDKLGLFCHMNGDRSDKEIEAGLTKQQKLLEAFAERHGGEVELVSLHVGNLSLDEPDSVLRGMLEAIQAGEVDKLVVVSRDSLGQIDLDRLPPVKVHILDEETDMVVGKDTASFKREAEPEPRAVFYYRRPSAATV